MRRTLIAVGVALFFTVVSAADDAPPSDLAGAVSRLAAAMDRLGTAMEKQAASSGDARALERVQVAVGILGLRMRKVDRIEDSRRQLENEIDEMGGQLAALKEQASDSDDARHQEGREPTAEERAMRAEMERRLTMIETQIKIMQGRKSSLETELDAEMRGLTSLEAILDDWLQQQK